MRALYRYHIIFRLEGINYMFSKNNKKMIAERSAERTLKYGLVKLNVGLASVLLATGLTFAGGQTASADTVTTSTEAQTTEVAPG